MVTKKAIVNYVKLNILKFFYTDDEGIPLYVTHHHLHKGLLLSSTMMQKKIFFLKVFSQV
jgi:hypothetical protein